MPGVPTDVVGRFRVIKYCMDEGRAGELNKEKTMHKKSINVQFISIEYIEVLI
jgi:hypothetical protein